MEIERKFLVNHPPLERAVSCEQIRQGYLAVDDTAKSSVRIRQRGGKYTLTAKAGVGVARHEVEFEIPGEQFELLWPLTQGSRLEKKRYCIPEGTVTVELDVFEGSLSGLILAEVEFDSLVQAQSFNPLPWFSRDVTMESTFTNAWIAQHGNPLHLACSPG